MNAIEILEVSLSEMDIQVVNEPVGESRTQEVVSGSKVGDDPVPDESTPNSSFGDENTLNSKQTQVKMNNRTGKPRKVSVKQAKNPSKQKDKDKDKDAEALFGPCPKRDPWPYGYIPEVPVALNMPFDPVKSETGDTVLPEEQCSNLFQNYNNVLAAATEYAIDYVQSQTPVPAVSAFRRLTFKDARFLLGNRKLIQRFDNTEQTIMWLSALDFMAVAYQCPAFYNLSPAYIKAIPRMFEQILKFSREVFCCWGVGAEDMQVRYNSAMGWLRLLVPYMKDEDRFDLTLCKILDEIVEMVYCIRHRIPITITRRKMAARKMAKVQSASLEMSGERDDQSQLQKDTRNLSLCVPFSKLDRVPSKYEPGSFKDATSGSLVEDDQQPCCSKSLMVTPKPSSDKDTACKNTPQPYTLESKLTKSTPEVHGLFTGKPSSDVSTPKFNSMLKAQMGKKKRESPDIEVIEGPFKKQKCSVKTSDEEVRRPLSPKKLNSQVNSENEADGKFPKIVNNIRNAFAFMMNRSRELTQQNKWGRPKK